MNIQPNEKPIPAYAELHCVSNFSFLRGASRPEELVDTALQLGCSALAITDECSMDGVVRACGRMKELANRDQTTVAPGRTSDSVMAQDTFKLIVGSEFSLGDGFRLVALARHLSGYARLCQLITEARRGADKGSYKITPTMIDNADLEDCCLLLVPPYLPTNRQGVEHWFEWFQALGPYTFLALRILFFDRLRYGKEVLNARMIAVYGKTQREQGVSHLVVRKLEDLSWMLGELSVDSRDFH